MKAAHHTQLTDRMIRRVYRSNSIAGRHWMRLAFGLSDFAWKAVCHTAEFVKRVCDVLISLVALFFAAPIMIVVAIAIKVDGGPVFFRQKRVGLHGKEFYMWKFRSMCIDAEEKLAALLAQNEKQNGITFKMENDPRVTPVGRFVRRTSIDELPQFFNVLVGEMSIVGPRPPVPREVALYSTEDRRRLLAKPGLTCLWQVGEKNGGLFEVSDRNKIDFDEQVKLDIGYIEQQNWKKDLWIMIKTPIAMLLGK